MKLTTAIVRHNPYTTFPDGGLPNFILRKRKQRLTFQNKQLQKSVIFNDRTRKNITEQNANKGNDKTRLINIIFNKILSEPR